jgi:hypothetical protein
MIEVLPADRQRQRDLSHADIGGEEVDIGRRDSIRREPVLRAERPLSFDGERPRRAMFC